MGSAKKRAFREDEGGSKAGHSGMQMGVAFRAMVLQPPSHAEIITWELWKIRLSRGDRMNLRM